VSSRTFAHVTPEVLRWARESAGYDIADAAKRIGVAANKLDSAELGEVTLTLRQAERAASVYARPLAALFMPRPPDEEPQTAQFRRLPGAPTPPWPPEMLLLARRVQERQEAAAELYEALDEAPPWPAVANEMRVSDGMPPSIARQLLGIGLEEQTGWHDQSGYEVLRNWIDAVEGLGVLVMQDGTLPVGMMRGFAAVHDTVPAIVVNTQDDARARAFTVIHELGHLCLAATGRQTGPATEAWCNDFAGEVLMPLSAVRRALQDAPARQAPVETVDAMALRFGVTPYAAAVRIAKAEIWTKRVIDEAIEEIQSRPARARSAGGDYYRTQIGRLSPAFIRLVFTALDSQTVTYPAASTLLGGLKVSNFDKLRDYLSRRAELA
jgi:Zn-dependent peptidase ImmA (M78 family)/transcriptional regulator with XRE-family HTH domain